MFQGQQLSTMMAEQATDSMGVPPLLDRMKMQREQLMSRVRDLDAAIEAMEKNPEVAGMVNAITKLGHV